MENHHWIVLISILVFVVSLAALPALLVFMPADYFTRSPEERGTRRHPALRILLLALKNALGGLLLLAGILMLFTPGQGLLGILAGLWLMDFPGKRRWERRIVARPGILNALNRVRAAFGRPPLERPEAEPKKNRREPIARSDY